MTSVAPLRAQAPVVDSATTTSQSRPIPAAVSTATAPASEDPLPELPVSLQRIREALERSPTSVLKLPDQPVFQVIIEGKLPEFADFVAPGELQINAMPVAMTHREFLTMATPEEARSFASFTNGELAQVVATGVAAGLAMSAISQAIRSGWHGWREQRAREEVEAVVEALRQRDEAKASPAPPP
jgi:hypothetical protein